MNFEISDDQRMLKDSVDRLIAEKYQLDHRLRFLDEPKGWSEDLWSDFVELGLTILPFPEEVGGLGLGPIETMIVGEAFGRGLVVEPYLPSIVFLKSTPPMIPVLFTSKRLRHSHVPMATPSS